MDAADGEHLAVAKPFRHLRRTSTPFICPIEISDPLAGVDHEATNRLDRVDVAHLTADRGGGGRVELRHAGRNVTERDEGKPPERDGEQLDVNLTDAPGN